MSFTDETKRLRPSCSLARRLYAGIFSQSPPLPTVRSPGPGYFTLFVMNHK